MITEEREETAKTYLTQVGWQGGTLTLRYVDAQSVPEESLQAIRDTMREFSTDCQRMLIWFAGVLGSREAIQRHLDDLATRGEPLAIKTYRPNGRVDSVLASLPVEDVAEAVSEEGEFEQLYSKAFVVFTFQIWEEVARPRIAGALNVKDPDHVTSNLMGDWRLLRNWLMHRTKKAEKDFFSKSKILPHLLGLRPEQPCLTVGMIAVLMQQLNNMEVDVNPSGLDFGVEKHFIDPEMVARMAMDMEPNHGLAPVQFLMIPSRVNVVFGDGPKATIHERDCSQSEVQFQSLENSRQVVVPSVPFAQQVVRELGKQEVLCSACITDEPE